MKLAWIDVRHLDGLTAAVVEEGIHAGIHGVVTDDADRLRDLPPTVTRVGVVPTTSVQEPAAGEELARVADILVVPEERRDDRARLAARYPEKEIGVLVEVTDQATLDVACRYAAETSWTVIDFRDPTKIPLEIVLAAADRAAGRVVTIVHDLVEAEIVLGVLERGSDGVLLPARAVGDASELARLCREQTDTVTLQELEVTSITHVGLGDRVCVDTCSHLRMDEGILVGSYASGMILACSETHPLPYMPTRPFRVNAGALHSYTLAPGNRTRYLSELGSGSELLAVSTNGQTRRVTVGRAKIETRPLLRIAARASSGGAVDLVVQDDWHVRVLGPGAVVLNVTDLEPGSVLLGSTLLDPRHVGYAVREFLLEK
jgi:3-amino-4-hydroxybenzoic acid synthase